MIEFVTVDAKECPYCKGELHVIEKDGDKQIQCEMCNKIFQIAWMFPTEWQQDFEKIQKEGEENR